MSVQLRFGLFGFAALLGACALAIAQGTLPHVPPGFTITRIATVAHARELAAAANGDLLVGTSENRVFIVAHAEDTPQAPHPFVSLDDSPVAGVLIAGNTLYLGSQFGVWKVPFVAGDPVARERPVKIVSVRTSGTSRDHTTTSLAASAGKLYISVGSSCNNCDVELDDTRATIQTMSLQGEALSAKAVHIRNAIALASNPNTGTVWAGVAGQDELEHGHPYEIFDSVSARAGTLDYGWPYCYENRRSVGPHDCRAVVVARVVFPAYETPIGAAFYPVHPHGRHVFPQSFWGGAFVTLHGSWHQPPVAPRVAFVPMHGDEPARSVNWSDPSAQWSEFVGGFQLADGTRIARPTGVAVGPQGDLFVADDYSGGIFRIRPVR